MSTYAIPVTKAKTSLDVDCDETKLPEHVFNEAVKLGLKAMLNRGMGEVTAEKIPDETVRKAKALEIAKTNLENMYAGKVRIIGGKPKGASGKVMVIARQIAKADVLEELRRARPDIKKSHIKPTDLTAAANAWLEANPEILKLAEEELKKREARVAEVTTEAKTKLTNVVSMIQEDDDLIAAANEKKAKDKAKRSGTKAGLDDVVAGMKTKGGKAAHATH